MSDNQHGPMITYLRENTIRIIELVFIVGVVTATMQSNISNQGEVLDKVANQLNQQSVVLSELAVTVAQLSVRVSHNEDDNTDVTRDLEKLSENCDKWREEVRDLERKQK